MPLTAARMPELKPFMITFVRCAGTHGAANVDCVTEWLPCVTAGARV
jgi:hypothetical protein